MPYAAFTFGLWTRISSMRNDDPAELDSGLVNCSNLVLFLKLSISVYFECVAQPAPSTARDLSSTAKLAPIC